MIEINDVIIEIERRISLIKTAIDDSTADKEEVSIETLDDIKDEFKDLIEWIKFNVQK